jgi:hypothetical protein
MVDCTQDNVDEMTVCKMSLHKMLVDKLAIDKRTLDKMSIYKITGKDDCIQVDYRQDHCR